MKGTAAIILLLLAFAVAISAQSGAAFVGDTVIERVVVGSDASQSYALYLPAGYDPKRAYPTVYVFDPGGRGVNAVTTYRKAATKYGYIVIGSNNSRNGLDAANLSGVLNLLWQDTHERFAINDKRVVAAGLSGGARVASSFANACRCAFAVVGSGAGFSEGSVVPNKSLPFIFVGTAGVDDMNYPELRDLQKRLTAAGVVNRLLTFDGGHQWPPEEIADAALEWIEIREMKVGLRQRDDNFIAAALRRRESDGDTRLATKDYLGAREDYSSAVSDMTGVGDISSVAKKLADVEASQDYKRAVKADADAMQKQNDVLSEIMGLEQGLSSPESRPDSLAAIRSKTESLRSRADDPQDSQDRRLARRVRTSIFIGATEAATLRYEPAKNYDMALAEMELASLMDPKSPGPPYQQARIYALKGDKKKALRFLAQAMAAGLRDMSRIANDPAFASVREEPEFRSIIAPKTSGQ
jgi:tetratricopeptide (TPR) repeat protein